MYLFRSLLFVPGNNRRFIEKAQKLDADVICFDLEDSVPDTEKPEARRLVRSALESRGSYRSLVYVRTNSPASGMIPVDLQEVIWSGIDGIVVPKVNSADELQEIIKKMDSLERGRQLMPVSVIPSIESALGVVNAYSIASSSKRIPAIVFGIFDLLNDMGVEYSKDSDGGYSRAKIPVDAAAAGVTPIDAIWQDLKDDEGLERDCKTGKSMGYRGKSIIHPKQISMTHEVFSPTQTEIRWAKKVRDSYLESMQTGRGATTINGKMIDEVHYKRAKALLDAAETN